MKNALPICHINGECFARTPIGKCKVLTECPREVCSFQKSIEKYLSDKKKYE